MTEPDEALLWAREDYAKQFRSRRSHVADSILSGFWDIEVEVRLPAHGYRAGSAASAERIKELEARVAELTEEVEDLRATNEALALPEGSVLITSFDWSPPLAKESDQ